MTCNCFDEILSILHFNNNNSALSSASPNHNKLHKIQLLTEFSNTRFNEVAIPEINKAVDDMMIPFKGKRRTKMYMPKKPVKLGLQTLVSN